MKENLVKLVTVLLVLVFSALALELFLGLCSPEGVESITLKNFFELFFGAFLPISLLFFALPWCVGLWNETHWLLKSSSSAFFWTIATVLVASMTMVADTPGYPYVSESQSFERLGMVACVIFVVVFSVITVSHFVGKLIERKC